MKSLFMLISPKKSGANRLQLIIASFLGVLLTVTLVQAEDFSTIAPLATSSLILDIQRIDTALVAVGERGHILISEDNGNSWIQARVPTRSTLTGVYFIDRQNGWAVGHDQVILRTQDGGQNWQLSFQDPEAESPLLDIYFLDSKHGYAVGAYGRFLESFDAGTTWEPRWISEDDWHLNQILTSDDMLFIAAESGTLYRSTDSGATWETLSPPYEGSFFGALPTNKDNLLLFGLRGHLFRSEDAGDSWTPIETGSEASLNDGLTLENGSIIIAGLAGTLLISQDQGLTFSLQQDSERKGFSALTQAADGTVVAVGDFGVQRLSEIDFVTKH